MKRKIKIAMIANSLSINGISTVIMNYCKNIDLSRFEFAVLAGSPIDAMYRAEFGRLGIKIVALPERKKDPKKYYKGLFKALRAERYDIVQVHGNSATITIELLVAWLCGAKIRIAHSHNTTCGNMRVHKIMYPLFRIMYTHAFACGEKAGEWLFGKDDFYVMKNGFCTERFKFYSEVRDAVREELGIKDKYVLGHIGRFNQQKNQEYLIKVFEKIAEERSDAVLLMVGTGPDEDKIRLLAEDSVYKNRIIFYGETSEPQKLYMAMDVFVFPSRHEGLPVTLLEAQITGLPCVVSEVITTEAFLSDNVYTLSIDADASVWAKLILEIEKIDREAFYISYENEINQYDIKKCAKQLEEKYCSVVGV